MTWTISIDADGHLQLPEAAREALRQHEGLNLKLEPNDPEKVVASSGEPETYLTMEDGLLVLAGGPPISLEQTNELIEKVRREREMRILHPELVEDCQ